MDRTVASPAWKESLDVAKPTGETCDTRQSRNKCFVPCRWKSKVTKSTTERAFGGEGAYYVSAATSRPAFALQAQVLYFICNGHPLYGL